MSSVDYAKVLKYLLKANMCDYFAFKPLECKDCSLALMVRVKPYGKQFAIPSTLPLITNCGAVMLQVDCILNVDIALANYVPLCAIGDDFAPLLVWPSKSDIYAKLNVDEPCLCKELCKALFNAAKCAGGISIISYSTGNCKPVLRSFMKERMAFEQILIEMELADENA